jgi:hypothetical protein
MQQLYAEIKKSSRYAHQANYHKARGDYPFQVHIDSDKEGYVVKGGVGGRYRLIDVNLYVFDDQGSKVRIR